MKRALALIEQAKKSQGAPEPEGSFPKKKTTRLPSGTRFEREDKLISDKPKLTRKNTAGNSYNRIESAEGGERSFKGKATRENLRQLDKKPDVHLLSIGGKT